MAENGHEDHEMNTEIQEALTKLGELEKDFMAVELDTLRQKEYSSRELYAKRNTLTAQIPSFWSEIFMSGALPSEIAAILMPLDAEILPHITFLNVERYQIKSDTEGEPRSLRFTFEFSENKFFTDKKIVKDFEYRAFGDAPGGYISKPVNFNWTKQAKKMGVNTLLDLAEQLYQAEQAFASKGEIEQSEREGLWQYEKLREELEKAEEQEQSDEDDKRSFLEWFGYRGAVNAPTSQTKPANGDAEEDSEDDEDEGDGALDVEIYPAGEDVALAIAEDLWPDAMDYYIQATADDDDEEGISDDDDAVPELVEAADFDGFDEEPEVDPRPAKKRKTKS